MSNNRKNTRFVSTEILEKNLDKYNRRINQLKTIQLQRQTELQLIMNQPEAWIRSQTWGKNASESHKKAKLEERKEWLAKRMLGLIFYL